VHWEVAVAQIAAKEWIGNARVFATKTVPQFNRESVAGKGAPSRRRSNSARKKLSFTQYQASSDLRDCSVEGVGTENSVFQFGAVSIQLSAALES